MSARADILAAIRRALRGGRDPKSIAAAAQALALKSIESRPRLPDGDLADAFAARLASDKVVGASVDRIARLADAPDALRRYCGVHGLGQILALQPDPLLQRLDWSGFTLKPAIGGDEILAVARARWAIAETGTLVFHSGANRRPSCLSCRCITSASSSARASSPILKITPTPNSNRRRREMPISSQGPAARPTSRALWCAARMGRPSFMRSSSQKKSTGCLRRRNGP